MEIKGCVAVVTGGTGALGRLICRALAQNGANVALVYQSSAAIAKETVEDLQKEVSVQSRPRPMSLSKEM